jgi:hypothetical protein
MNAQTAAQLNDKIKTAELRATRLQLALIEIRAAAPDGARMLQLVQEALRI